MQFNVSVPKTFKDCHNEGSLFDYLKTYIYINTYVYIYIDRYTHTGKYTHMRIFFGKHFKQY